MVRVLRFFVALLASLRSSQARRGAEILYLRPQLIVLRRSAPARPRLKAMDRLISVCFYCLFPSLIDASIVFQPETLLRRHRRGFSPVLALEVVAAGRRPALPVDIQVSFDGSVARTRSGARHVSMVNCSRSASRSRNLSLTTSHGRLRSILLRCLMARGFDISIQRLASGGRCRAASTPYQRKPPRSGPRMACASSTRSRCSFRSRRRWGRRRGTCCGCA